MLSAPTTRTSELDSASNVSPIVYLDAALRYAPQLVLQLDTSAFSPTYGCFDREYWHYRTADFPCAMHAACILPLGLLWQIPHAQNPLYRCARVPEWIEAAIAFAARSAHRDGSGDDYYPQERALGASAFSLFALTECLLRTGIRAPAHTGFFARRGAWIATHRESGGISNHQALAALALYNVFLLTGDARFEDWARERAETVIGALTQEGWFPEYGGCDPGYNTWTIGFLAHYARKCGNPQVSEALRPAVRFTQHFLHPDGSCGGAYGARESNNFFPHGFELLAPTQPEAAWICTRARAALKADRLARFDDHRIFQHHVENYLLAWLDHAPAPLAAEGPPQSYERHFAQAGLFVRADSTTHFVTSLKKGGAFCLYRHGDLAHCESGLVGRTSQRRVVLSNLHDETRQVTVGDARVEIGGDLHVHEEPRSSTLKLIVFRLLLVVVGFCPALSPHLKALLQRLLVVGKRPAPFRHRRRFTWRGDRLVVADQLERTGTERITELALASDQATRYTAIGNVYHAGRLVPWRALPDVATELNERARANLERQFE
ncbi:MAG: hypothetical protein ACKVX7_08630 [Planctomycetota bacterium]